MQRLKKRERNTLKKRDHAYFRANPISLAGLIRLLRQLVERPKEFARLANEEAVGREALNGSHRAPLFNRK